MASTPAGVKEDDRQNRQGAEAIEFGSIVKSMGELVGGFNWDLRRHICKCKLPRRPILLGILTISLPAMITGLDFSVKDLP